eukprot:3853732-Rhodomonas_salina.1
MEMQTKAPVDAVQEHQKEEAEDFGNFWFSLGANAYGTGTRVAFDRAHDGDANVFSPLSSYLGASGPRAGGLRPERPLFIAAWCTRGRPIYSGSPKVRREKA